MSKTCRIGIPSLALIYLCSLCFGQSLGDIAREQRQKEKAKPAQAKAKVVTNEDLPDRGNSADGPFQPSSAVSTPSAPPDSASKEERGQQWQKAIQQQKAAVAQMQAQLDKLNASIHYVEANRYSNGVEYNQYQARKQEEAQRMQKQLDEQKEKLSAMQESARREGFGSSIYDP